MIEILSCENQKKNRKMQNVETDVFDCIVAYLSLRDFWALSLCSKSLDMRLDKFKDLKRLFFVLIKWTDWKETFRKFHRRDMRGYGDLSRFKQFELEYKLLWKNQSFILHLFQNEEHFPKDVEIRAIPYVFRNCFRASKTSLSVSKYDKWLIENETDFSNIIREHNFLKQYLSKTDAYMDDLTRELALKFEK